jgi:hypothetical protein
MALSLLTLLWQQGPDFVLEHWALLFPQTISPHPLSLCLHFSSSGRFHWIFYNSATPSLTQLLPPFSPMSSCWLPFFSMNYPNGLLSFSVKHLQGSTCWNHSCLISFLLCLRCPVHSEGLGISQHPLSSDHPGFFRNFERFPRMPPLVERIRKWCRFNHRSICSTRRWLIAHFLVGRHVWCLRLENVTTGPKQILAVLWDWTCKD